MANQDWCLFFGQDEVEFQVWYLSYRRKLVSQIAHGFPVTFEDALEIVDEAFQICLGRAQPENLQHLQGALALTARNVALNAIRRERRRDEIRSRFSDTNVGGLRDGDEVRDNAPQLEDVLADRDFHAFCLTLFTEVKARLTADGKERALKILAVMEKQGLQVKRSEMIRQTGLSAEVVDAAQKQVNRAFMNKDVRAHVRLQWLATFSKRPDSNVAQQRGTGKVPSNLSIPENENVSANELFEVVSKAFDRVTVPRK
jgi:hypothetical protein